MIGYTKGRASGIEVLMASFRRTLEAQNKSPNTIEIYGSALVRFSEYLDAQTRGNVSRIQRKHVEGFMASLLSNRKPATAHNRYRALRAFFNWAVTEGEIAVTPMQHTKAPAVPEVSPAVLSDEQLRQMLRGCEGTSFANRRDTAIIRLLLHGHAASRACRLEG